MTKKQREERLAWVASLKEGDEVAIVKAERGAPVPDDDPFLAAFVRRNTLSGDIVVNRAGFQGCRGNLYFDSRGYMRKDGFYACASAIVPVTDEHRMAWAANDVLSRMRKLFGGYGPVPVSPDKLLRIGAILDEDNTP